MIDLYRLHSGFPGRDDAERSRTDPYRRVELLEQSWAADIGDARFIPHIQLHEYEAYLFVDVTRFRLFYPRQQSQIDELSRISEETETPELIDDGENTSPSKRIITQIPQYESAKATVGPQVAEEIGLSGIRAKCPHFHGWLTRLEQLGAGTDTANGREPRKS